MSQILVPYDKPFQTLVTGAPLDDDFRLWYRSKQERDGQTIFFSDSDLLDDVRPLNDYRNELGQIRLGKFKRNFILEQYGSNKQEIIDTYGDWVNEDEYILMRKESEIEQPSFLFIKASKRGNLVYRKRVKKRLKPIVEICSGDVNVTKDDSGFIFVECVDRFPYNIIHPFSDEDNKPHYLVKYEKKDKNDQISQNELCINEREYLKNPKAFNDNFRMEGMLNITVMDLKNGYVDGKKDKIGDKRSLRKSNVMFGTLTYDSKRCDVKTAWENIGNEYNRFISNLKKRYGKFSVFRVWESFDKSGYPHIHFIFIFEDRSFRCFYDPKNDCFRLCGKQKLIDEYWHSFTDIKIIVVDKDRKNDIKKTVGYLIKYLTKIQNPNDHKHKQTLALLWFFGKRSYGLSGNFLDLITSCITQTPKYDLFDDQPPKTAYSYTFIGILPKWVLKVKLKDADFFSLTSLNDDMTGNIKRLIEFENSKKIQRVKFACGIDEKTEEKKTCFQRYRDRVDDKAFIYYEPLRF